MKKYLLVIAFCLLATSGLLAQKENYVGYSPLFNPELIAELPHEVHETSGLFFHNGLLWTHNDSGGKPIL